MQVIARPVKKQVFCYHFKTYMPRPTILVAEPEPLEALSTRKLVLETGKFNVVTAHSTREAIDLFNLFPNINCVVLENGGAVDSREVARVIRTTSAKPPIISLDPRQAAKSTYADYTLSSHEPVELLELLRQLFGDPRNLDRLARDSD